MRQNYVCQYIRTPTNKALAIGVQVIRLYAGREIYLTHHFERVTVTLEDGVWVGIRANGDRVIYDEFGQVSEIRDSANLFAIYTGWITYPKFNKGWPFVSSDRNGKGHEHQSEPTMGDGAYSDAPSRPRVDLDGRFCGGWEFSITTATSIHPNLKAGV
jgi:hypothetical protein